MQLLEELPEIDQNGFNEQDSLEIFIEKCVKVTNAETDTEYIDEFIEKFNVFCDKYRLPRKEVRADEMTSNMKYKFGLTIIPRKKLVRKINEELEINEKTFSFYDFLKNFLLKTITFGKYVDKKKLRSKYLLDEAQLNYHFDILLTPDDQDLYNDFSRKYIENDQNYETIITKKAVINKMIYHSYWYYWILMDVIMIFIQQLVTAICIIPFFLLVLLQEITYSPYSIIDPKHLITLGDLKDNPWQILGNILNFTIWNIIIVSICIFFMIYSFIDCLIYFCYSRFPEDRAFEENQKVIKKNKLIKYLTNFQWFLIFFFVFCYSSYIGLVCVWLLLGAIINPNNFLVYSTASINIFNVFKLEISSISKDLRRWV